VFTNFIEFQTRRNKLVSQLKIKTGKEEINEVEITNFLGIDIDNNLIWEKHRDKICNTISGNLFVIKRLSSIADLDVLYTAYYGLVYLFLTYGIAVWGHSCKEEGLERTNLPTFLTLFKNVICIKTSVCPNITFVGNSVPISKHSHKQNNL
jgi:hypothetical protein